MILGINTSGEFTEIVLANGQVIDRKKWAGGYELSELLLGEISKLLVRHELKWGDITGVAVFKGPGSFTGLRIGFTVGNTIAYSLGVPIASAAGNDWLRTAAQKLKSKKPGEFEAPEYGAPAKITLPKAK